VVASGVGGRKLVLAPVEGVPAVTNPIRPRDQILPSTGRAHLIEAKPAYHISTLDGQAAQRRAPLGDNSSGETRDDLVLFARGRSAHELALYRHGHTTITLGLLCRQCPTRRPYFRAHIKFVPTGAR